MTNKAKRHITTTKKQLSSRESDGLSIVIPAAGMGYRMKSHGPKALVNLGHGLTLIERQIMILNKEYPNADIFVVVGFQAEKIRKQLKDYPVRFISNPIHQTTNVLYSIGLALQACLTTSVLIVYGDLIFNRSAVAGLQNCKSKIVVDIDGKLNDDEVGVILSENEVTNLAYGLKNKWAQIVYLTKDELSEFTTIALNPDTSQWFGYEGLKAVLDKGGHLEAIKPDGLQLMEIDVTKDLDKVKQIGNIL